MNEHAPTNNPATPIRLIATDMDGTFLGADGFPSQANCEAVCRAAEIGVPTVFATGRPSRWIQPLDPVRDAHPFVITSNGAVIMDLEHDTVIHHRPLDPATVTAVVQDVRSAVPAVSFAVEYLRAWGREELYPILWYEEAEVIAPIEELLTHGTAVKLLIRAPIPTPDLMALAAPAVGDRLTVTFSCVTELGFLEVSPPGISKASALRQVLADLGVPASDVAAFGDMPNDLAMLDLVGHPFVMSNGHDLLKQRGFPICGHHDDSAFGTTVTEILGLSNGRTE